MLAAVDGSIKWSKQALEGLQIFSVVHRVVPHVIEGELR